MFSYSTFVVMAFDNIHCQIQTEVRREWGYINEKRIGNRPFSNCLLFFKESFKIPGYWSALNSFLFSSVFAVCIVLCFCLLLMYQFHNRALAFLRLVTLYNSFQLQLILDCTKDFRCSINNDVRLIFIVSFNFSTLFYLFGIYERI